MMAAAINNRAKDEHRRLSHVEYSKTLKRPSSNATPLPDNEHLWKAAGEFMKLARQKTATALIIYLLHKRRRRRKKRRANTLGG